MQDEYRAKTKFCSLATANHPQQKRSKFLECEYGNENEQTMVSSWGEQATMDAPTFTKMWRVLKSKILSVHVVPTNLSKRQTKVSNPPPGIPPNIVVPLSTKISSRPWGTNPRAMFTRNGITGFLFHGLRGVVVNHKPHQNSQSETKLKPDTVQRYTPTQSFKPKLSYKKE